MKKIILYFTVVIFITTVSLAQTKENKTLLTIKQNYNRINTIKKWSQVIEIKDYKAFDEGLDNKVNAFYQNEKLEKISVILHREMFKSEEEFYFLNNELSFVISKMTSYQKPFEATGAKTLTDKLYFADKKLIHLIKQQDSGWDMPSPEEVYELFQEAADKIIKKE